MQSLNKGYCTEKKNWDCSQCDSKTVYQDGAQTWRQEVLQQDDGEAQKKQTDSHLGGGHSSCGSRAQAAGREILLVVEDMLRKQQDWLLVNVSKETVFKTPVYNFTVNLKRKSHYKYCHYFFSSGADFLQQPA